MSAGVVDAGMSIQWETTQSVKMSEVLLDFVAPYMEAADSDEEVKKLVLLGLLAWNIALLPADVREESLPSLIAEAVPADVAAGFKEIIDHMIERKEKHFAENRRFVLAHHWTMTGKGPHLSVVSTTA
jgi:hypothetical protein